MESPLSSFPEKILKRVVPTPGEERAFLISWFIILLLFSIYFTGFLGLITGLGINQIELPLSLVLAVTGFHLSVKALLSIRAELRIIAISLFLALVCVVLSRLIFDTTWDGQWYHETAIVKITRGWNPYFLPFYAPGSADLTSFVPIQHYPKCAWICASVIYRFSGLISSGKSINLLIALAGFFNGYALVSIFIKKELWKIIFCVAISLNPVVICQLFSHMVDGLMASLFLLIILQLIALEHQKDAFCRHRWAIIAISVIMASNLKFTGLAIPFLIILVFSIYWVIRRHPFRVFMRRVALFTGIFLLAFCLFGYNPYITNWRADKNPFYPLNDSTFTRFDLNTPRLLRNKGNLEKLFLSVTSISNNDMLTSRFFWKNPFYIYRSELRLFATSDVRLSGFGPLFQLILILTIILLGWNLFQGSPGPVKWLSLVLVGGILFSTLISPVGWMARFTPQFYLLPFVVVLGSAWFFPASRKIWLAKALLLVCCLNLVVVGGSNLSANVIKTILIQRQLDTLAQYHMPIPVLFGQSEFQCERIRLQEAHIPFVEVDRILGPVHLFRMDYRFNKAFPRYGIPSVQGTGTAAARRPPPSR